MKWNEISKSLEQFSACNSRIRKIILTDFLGENVFAFATLKIAMACEIQIKRNLFNSSHAKWNPPNEIYRTKIQKTHLKRQIAHEKHCIVNLNLCLNENHALLAIALIAFTAKIASIRCDWWFLCNLQVANNTRSSKLAKSVYANFCAMNSILWRD